MTVGESPEQIVASLQTGVVERQDALRNLSRTIADQADALGRRAAASNLALIVLGVVIAGRPAIEEVTGSSRASLASFTLVGLLVSAISGIEAVFGWQKRSAKLTMLASEGVASLRRLDSVWRLSYRTAEYDEERIEALNDVLTQQDEALAHIEVGAAEQGLNHVTQALDPQIHGRQAYPA